MKQVLDLPEIAMRVLVKDKRVIRSDQGSLEGAEGGVGGHERRMVNAERIAARDVLLVADTHAVVGCQAPHTIGDGTGRCDQIFRCEVFHRLLCEQASRQIQDDSMSRLGGLHCGDEGVLVLGASRALATDSLVSEAGVIGLDAPVEPACVLAQEYHVHKFVI